MMLFLCAASAAAAAAGGHAVPLQQLGHTPAQLAAGFDPRARVWALAAGMIALPDAPNPDAAASLSFIIDINAPYTSITSAAASALGYPHVVNTRVALSELHLNGVGLTPTDPPPKPLRIRGITPYCFTPGAGAPEAAGVLGLDVLGNFDLEFFLRPEEPRVLFHPGLSASAGKIDLSGLVPSEGRHLPLPHVKGEPEFEITVLTVQLVAIPGGGGWSNRDPSGDIDAILDLNSPLSYVNPTAGASIGFVGEKVVSSATPDGKWVAQQGETFKADVILGGSRDRLGEVHGGVRRTVTFTLAPMPMYEQIGDKGTSNKRPVLLLGLGAAPEYHFVFSHRHYTMWVEAESNSPWFVQPPAPAPSGVQIVPPDDDSEDDEPWVPPPLEDASPPPPKGYSYFQTVEGNAVPRGRGCRRRRLEEGVSPQGAPAEAVEWREDWALRLHCWWLEYQPWGWQRWVELGDQSLLPGPEKEVSQHVGRSIPSSIPALPQTQPQQERAARGYSVSTSTSAMWNAALAGGAAGAVLAAGLFMGVLVRRSKGRAALVNRPANQHATSHMSC